MNDIKPKLDKLKEELSYDNCRYCGTQPTLVISGQLAFITCSNCAINARGYLSAPCMKMEGDLRQSMVRLQRSWNGRMKVNPYSN
jgi:hypothetical protein